MKNPTASPFQGCRVSALSRARHLVQLAAFSVSALSLLALAPGAWAANTVYTWNNATAGTYSWTAGAANWSPSAPVGSTTATIQFFNNTTTALGQPTYTIASDDPGTLSLNILSLEGLGASATAATAVNLGTAGNTWTLGGTTPTVNLDGLVGTEGLSYNILPNLTLGANTTFTGSGTAGFTFSGNITGSYALTKNGPSTLTLSGANTYSGGTPISAGTLTLSGANTYGSGTTTIGSATGNAVLNLPNGGSVTANNSGNTASFDVATVSGANGAINLSGGSLTVTGSAYEQNLNIGFAGYGFLNVAGSSTLSVPRLQMGGNASYTGTGVALFSGGTATISEFLLMSRIAGANSSLTVASGGTINHKTSGGGAAAGNIALGYGGGRAELNLTGGTLDSTGTSLTVRQSGGTATGVVNLNSGTLTVNSFTNNSGSAYLNFNGGTLKAGAASATFVPSTMTAVNVYSGGATINDGGYAITAAAPLIAPGNTGVTGITVSAPGAGYIGAPYVSITGGTLASGGSPATAIANMVSDGSGNGTYAVGSITITCPGVYTAAPTGVTFIGGGYTTIASGPTITTAANTSGGLTKQGAGTLTLSGANTFGGGLTVNNGTVSFASDGSTAGTGYPLGVYPSSVTPAAVTLNGGGLTNTISTTIAANRGITLGASGGTLDASPGQTLTVNSVIAGSSYSLTKGTGGGTLILGAANTYSGTTTVSGGTLLVNNTLASSAVTVASGATLGGNGTISGPVNVSAGGYLAPGGIDAIGTLTLAANSASSLTLNGNQLFFDLPSSGNTCDLIAISGASGALVLNGANYIQLTAPSGAATGNYALMTYAAKTGSGTLTFPNGSTTMTVGSSTLTLNVTAGGSGPGSGSVTLTISSAAVAALNSDVWSGATSYAWDTSSVNWTKNGAASSAFSTGDAVTFDDTGLAASPITSSGTVSPSSVMFNNSVNSYTLSATIGGTGTPLFKNGSGTTILSGANTYSGGTTLSAGQLNINNGGSSAANSAIGTGALTISSGSIDNTSGSDVTLQPNNSQNWNGNFTYVGSANNLNLGSGAVMLGASPQVTVSGKTLTVGGNITGSSYALTKAGSGTLALAGANTYSGGTTLSAGQLNINNGGSSAANSAIGTGTLTISGGTIDNTSGSDVTLQPNNSQNWNGNFTYVGSANNLNLGSGAVMLGCQSPSDRQWQNAHRRGKYNRQQLCADQGGQRHPGSGRREHLQRRHHAFGGAIEHQQWRFECGQFRHRHGHVDHQRRHD